MNELEEQQVTRYVDRLDYALQDRLSLEFIQTFLTQNMALKVEFQLSRTNNCYKGIKKVNNKQIEGVQTTIQNPGTTYSTVTKTPQAQKSQTVGKNPYAKATGDKCYICGEMSHCSKCLACKPVQ